MEYKITPQIRLVAAGRLDDGDLIDGPVLAQGRDGLQPEREPLVPGLGEPARSRRRTTPSSSSRSRSPRRRPAPRQLEGGIEQYYAALQGAPLPPGALTGLTITNNLPWNFSPATNALALGNSELEVEKVTGWELGYKGTLSEKVYVTADAYINELSNFVTDLLPGVNPALPQLRAHETASTCRRS